MIEKYDNDTTSKDDTTRNNEVTFANDIKGGTGDNYFKQL